MLPAVRLPSSRATLPATIKFQSILNAEIPFFPPTPKAVEKIHPAMSGCKGRDKREIIGSSKTPPVIEDKENNQSLWITIRRTE